MRPPCEHAARNVLPAVPALIAKRLVVDHGVPQVEAARKLGLTQAAVSFYVGSQRGGQRLDTLARNDRARTTVTEVTAQLLADPSGTHDVVARLCELCKALRSERSIG